MLLGAGSTCPGGCVSATRRIPDTNACMHYIGLHHGPRAPAALSLAETCKVCASPFPGCIQHPAGRGNAGIPSHSFLCVSMVPPPAAPNSGAATSATDTNCPPNLALAPLRAAGEQQALPGRAPCRGRVYGTFVYKEPASLKATTGKTGLRLAARWRGVLALWYTTPAEPSPRAAGPAGPKHWG